MAAHHRRLIIHFRHLPSYVAAGRYQKTDEALELRLTAFDPIGMWRFLRVPGAGKGYPVVVAGGPEGDLPLTVAGAPEIVRAAMHNGVLLGHRPVRHPAGQGGLAQDRHRVRTGAPGRPRGSWRPTAGDSAASASLD
jgi:hypothetical protein